MLHGYFIQKSQFPEQYAFIQEILFPRPYAKVASKTVMGVEIGDGLKCRR